jgi:MFS family permease
MSQPRTTLRQGIRTLPGPVWILCAGSFVNRFGSFVAVFLVLYLRNEGYSIAEAGLVVSFYGIGNVVAAAVGGWIADRLGRRNAIALSMFGSAATLLLLSQAHSLAPILVLTTLAGLTGEMYRPATAALLTDLTPQGERIPAFALNRLAINAGFAAGPATAGFLAEESFFLVFLGDALTSVVFGVIALVALPEGVRVRRSEERRGEGLRTIIRDRAFVFFLVSSVLGAFVYFQG